jgi:hypothetical protein
VVHPANEYASFQKLFHPWFLEDNPKGFSSIVILDTPRGVAGFPENKSIHGGKRLI